MIKRARGVLAWGRENIEITTLAVLAFLVSLIWALAELTDEVVEGETRDLDSRILLALRTPGDLADPIGPAWLEEMARDMTALGGILVLSVVTVLVGLFLALRRRFLVALYLWVAVGGGILLSSFAKGFFDRARPDLVPHGSIVHTSSFPSGHSMMAAICYLTLGALIARVQPTRTLKIFVMVVAVALTLMVGTSRVYLGVHWPTDVAAGWLGGALWAAVCMIAAHALARRGKIARVKGEE